MNAHDCGQAATAKYQAGSQTTFVQRRITGYPEVTLLLSITGGVLKNSSLENSQKIQRVRMPYKRFSRTWWTFSITGFEAVCAENEFFNSHRAMHSSTSSDHSSRSSEAKLFRS